MPVVGFNASHEQIDPAALLTAGCAAVFSERVLPQPDVRRKA